MSFKKKLFGWTPAQEGLEEPVPPTDIPTDITIPEGGANEQDPGAEPQQDPAIGALDDQSGSSAPVGDGEAGDGLDDPDAEDDDADKPIEFFAQDELNVEHVAQVEAADDKLAAEQSIRSESVDEAVAESKNMVAAIEGLVETLVSGKGIGEMTGRSLSVNLATHRARLGFADPHGALAFEAFQPDTQGKPKHSALENAKIAMEGFRSTLRTILETIVRTIQAAIAWLVKMVKKHLFDLKAVTKQTQVLTKAVLEQRSEDKAGLIANAEGNASKYVSFQNATAMGLTRLLKIGGEQPNDYPSAFVAVHDELKAHLGYREVFGQKFVDGVSKVFGEITGDTVEGEEHVALAAPITRILSKNSLVLDPRDLRDVQLPPKVQPPFKGFYVDGLLGDVAFYHFLNKNLVARSLEEELQGLGAWHFLRRSTASKGSDDGFLRLLATSEVKHGSEMIEQIENELALYAGTVDQLEHVEGQLKDLALKASRQLAPMDNSEAIFNEANKEHGWKGGLLTSLVAAISNVVANVNTSLFEYQRYGQMVCIAWNHYLKAIYDKEQALVLAGKKVV